ARAAPPGRPSPEAGRTLGAAAGKRQGSCQPGPPPARNLLGIRGFTRTGRPRQRAPPKAACHLHPLEPFIVPREHRKVLTLCLIAFSSREPVPTSLENALTPSDAGDGVALAMISAPISDPDFLTGVLHVSDAGSQARSQHLRLRIEADGEADGLPGV